MTYVDASYQKLGLLLVELDDQFKYKLWKSDSLLLIQHWSQPNNEEIRQYLSIKSNQLQSLLTVFKRPEGGSLQWGLKQFGGSN